MAIEGPEGQNNARQGGPRPNPAAARSRRRWRRTLAATCGIGALAVAGTLVWSTRTLNGSLPQLDGQTALSGLTGPVTVDRDAAGVPTLTGGDRLSLIRALGFLHAQERFFQMDLMRRDGAGELAQLVGPLAADHDRDHRLHRFRARAHQAVELAGPDTREALQAYADGVNAGLRALSHMPLEYTLLRQDPEPWQPEDTLLVNAAMAFNLEPSNGWDEQRLARAIDTLGPEMAAFLLPAGTRRDAALDASALDEPPMPTGYGPARAAAPAPAPAPAPTGAVPNPDSPPADAPAAAPAPAPAPAPAGNPATTVEPGTPGSNAFAVDGSLTAHGGGMLANDMHLGLREPNTWFRARLVVKPAGLSAPTLDIVGLTLPGSPLMITGSNGHVAWGYTDAYIDTGDVVVLDAVDGDEERYQTPNGPKALTHTREPLCADPQCPVLDVEDSVWGPVVGRDAKGRKLVYRWQAHDVDADLVTWGLAMERAGSVDEAVDIAHHEAIPDENLVVTDSAGNVAWTIVGRVPRRFGHDGRLPVSWADGKAGWAGYLSPDEIPVIKNPAGHRVWTANTRVVGGDALARLGFGDYSEGSRAGQIRDDLLAHDRFDEKGLMAIQLDDNAPFLQFWQHQLLQSLSERAADGVLSGMAPQVENWGGRAVPASVGYRLVHDFRSAVLNRIYDAYLSPLAADAAHAGGRLNNPQAEGPVRRLLTDRPAGLVPPGYKSWDALIDAAIKDLRDTIDQSAGGDLSRYTWGARNRAGIHHPLSHAVPALAPYLDPPDVAVPGDLFVPRVAAPGFGASERLVVAPGHEENGLFHMPTGQSGHPLSPYYNAGHQDWVDGRPTPLLPGPARWHLTLVPKSGAGDGPGKAATPGAAS